MTGLVKLASIFSVIITFIFFCPCLKADTSLGPLTLYCQNIKPKFIAISKSIPNLNKSITVAFSVNQAGQIKEVQGSGDEFAQCSANTKKILLDKVIALKQLQIPPANTKYPFWLSVDLCNDLEEVCIQVKDLNWNAYMADMNNRIKKNWFAPVHSKDKTLTVTFKILLDGSISNLEIIKSAGLRTMDLSGLQAVNNAAPFKPLLDGVSDPIKIEFTFDYHCTAPHK
jgi:TonB family protein